MSSVSSPSVVSVVSDIQLEANRTNAQRSTGPRTSDGKTKSSRNAMKFGIFSAQVLLPGEDGAVYEAFRAGMYRRLDPRDELERMLADRVVLSAWKLRRVQAAEADRYGQLRAAQVDWKRVDGKLVSVARDSSRIISSYFEQFEHFAKCEAALERSMYRATAELRKVQSERGEDDVEPAADADEPAGKNEPISDTEAASTATADDRVCKNKPISSAPKSADAPADEPVRENEPISSDGTSTPTSGSGGNVSRPSP